VSRFIPSCLDISLFDFRAKDAAMTRVCFAGGVYNPRFLVAPFCPFSSIQQILALPSCRFSPSLSGLPLARFWPVVIQLHLTPQDVPFVNGRFAEWW
jgi:hypothetical protein